MVFLLQDVEVTFGEADESGFSDIAELLGAKVQQGIIFLTIFSRFLSNKKQFYYMFNKIDDM